MARVLAAAKTSRFNPGLVATVVNTRPVRRWSGPSVLLVGLLATWLTGAECQAAGLTIALERWDVAPGPCLLVHNRGVDAIAEYRTDANGPVLRAGSWLGRDGRYLLPRPEPGVQVVVHTIAGLPVSAEQIEVLDCPVEMTVEAVQALTTALDLRLAAYYGETMHSEAIEQAFEEAFEWLDKPELVPYLALARYEAGAFLRAIGRLEAASVQYGAAADLFERVDDLAGLAASVNALGLVAWRLGELDRAVRYYQRAHALRDDLGDDFALAAIANNLGLIHARRDEFAEAVTWYESALNVLQGVTDLRRNVAPGDWSDADQPPEADLPLALNTLNNLALVLRQQGQIEVAERYWRNYLALEAHVPSPVMIARARMNFARLLISRGQLHEALWLLTSALSQFETAGEPRWVVEALSELAQLYHYLGDPAGAMAHARNAVAIHHEDVAAAADARRQLARLLLAQGFHDEAMGELEQAETLALSADSTIRWLQIRSDLLRTRFLANPSMVWLDEQREVHLQLGALGHPGQSAIALSRIGEKQFLLGDYEAAQQSLESAIEAHIAVDDQMSEFDSLVLLGRVLNRMDESAAIEVNSRAIDLADSLRHAALPTLRRAELLASLHELYQRQALALVETGRPTDAWILAERARMHDPLVRSPPTDDRPGIGDSLLDQRADLLGRMHLIRMQQRSAPDSQAAMQALMPLQRELDAVETTLEKMNRPQQVVGWPDVPAQIQAHLGSDVLLLSYLVLADRVLMWIVSGDGWRLQQLTRNEERDTEIIALRELVRHPRQATGRIYQQAARLGQWLVGPAADELAERKTVLVQADDVLHGIPFALLIQSAADDALPLIEQHELRLIPGPISALQSPTDQMRTSPSLLLMADPGWSAEDGAVAMLPEQSLLAGLLRSERLTDLPGSRLEADAIASRASQYMKVRVRTGSEATREFITGGGLSEYRIVHLATHGLVDLQYPMLSSLLLASEDAVGPAFLRPSEIVGLKLKAELVVLSGCETGYGRIISGAGMLSLAQPFLSAGASEVLASLWKIDDSRTAKFMDRFYHHFLDESLTAAQALSATQRWMRRQPATSHPYYWAGFVLLGNG